VYTISPPNLECGAVTALQPAPALSLLGIARADGSIIIHDIRADKQIVKLNQKSSQRHAVTSMSFRTDDLGAGEDGRKAGVLATAGLQDGDVTLWDLNNGGRVMGVLRNAHNPPSSSQGGVAGGVTRVEFLPGQATIVTSGRDNALRSWIFDEQPFSPVPRILHSRSGHAAAVTKLDFLPLDSDGSEAIGKWLLSAGRDQSLWGWSLRRDGQSTELSQGNIRKKARKLGYLAGGLEGEATSNLEELKAPEITCMASCLNRDGGMGTSTGGGAVWANVTNSKAKKSDDDRPVTGWESVITGHRGDKFARTWFWGRKKAGRWAFETSDGTEVKSVAMSACGTFALVGSAGGSVDMFNLQSGIHRQRFPAPISPAYARKLKLQQQSEETALATFGEGRTFGPGQGKHRREVTGIMVDSLNRTVISCGLDGKIKFWDFRTGTLKHELDWLTAPTAARHHRSSDLIAFSCDDLSIRVVDTETRKTVRELWGCVGGIRDFCFSNDGRWIVAASMDSVIRVWDLPTGHLIDAVKLEGACTALAFSVTGEFLATAHADSIGINIWTNRALFTHVPTRHIDEDEVRKVDLPNASGEGGQPLLESAFEEQGPTEADDAVPSSTVDQLSSEIMTLSLVPRNRWQTLVHLDTIAQRNKPIEAPKAPEKAPFFLPSLDKLNEAKQEGTRSSQALTVTESERSRISALQRHAGQRPFTALLQSVREDHEAFITHFKTLPPAAADIEIRSLNTLSSPSELMLFVQALTRRLRQKRDYEVIQAWMTVFLRVHGESIAENDELLSALHEWRQVQAAEAKRLGGLVGYCGGVVSFLRSAR
jgi:U3 small nucleolar RNA-associated protein 21